MEKTRCSGKKPSKQSLLYGCVSCCTTRGVPFRGRKDKTGRGRTASVMMYTSAQAGLAGQVLALDLFWFDLVGLLVVL